MCWQCWRCIIKCTSSQQLTTNWQTKCRFTFELCGGTLVSCTNSISKRDYLFMGWLNLCLHDLVGYRASEDWKSKSIGNLTLPIQIITPWFKCACVTLGESSHLPPSSTESDLYWCSYNLCARDKVLWDPGVLAQVHLLWTCMALSQP